MAEQQAPDTNNAVTVTPVAPPLKTGVLDLTNVEPTEAPGSRVFTHYNGPTGQLDGMCTGMAILAPGASPHPPHRHPEEEFLIISEGTGEILCDGKLTQVGPGAIMYCAANVLHGITNTGTAQMTFYWSKWIAKV